MAKHIGIVACSAEGAALCYRTICVEGAAIPGKYAHPGVTMHTPPILSPKLPSAFARPKSFNRIQTKTRRNNSIRKRL